MRLRGAEGRVVDTLLDFALKTWGKPLHRARMEDFWVYDDVPTTCRQRRSSTRCSSRGSSWICP